MSIEENRNNLNKKNVPVFIRNDFNTMWSSFQRLEKYVCDITVGNEYVKEVKYECPEIAWNSPGGVQEFILNRKVLDKFTPNTENFKAEVIIRRDGTLLIKEIIVIPDEKKIEETGKDCPFYEKRRKIAIALSLQRSLNHRNSIMEKLARLLVDTQAVPEHGKDFPVKPLIMVDIAKALNISDSSISRAMKDRYFELPDKRIALFSEFTFTKIATDKGYMARQEAMDKMKAMIDAEDPLKPLADDELAAKLTAQGIHIKRRTVAKYRKILEIGNVAIRGKEPGKNRHEQLFAEKCPICGADMAVKQAYRGSGKGRYFWGCKRFPACRGTRNIPDDMQRLFEKPARSAPPEKPDIDEELKSRIIRILPKLTDRDRQMVKMRAGIDGEPQTLESVGNKFGVTKERVRQVMTMALRKANHPANLK